VTKEQEHNTEQQVGAQSTGLEATKQALVSEIADMLEEWEASSELTSDFARRLVDHFLKNRDQILQISPEANGPIA